MRIIVIGSSGFIGKWITLLIDRQKGDWAGIDIQPKHKEQTPSHFYQIDFTNRSQLKAAFDEYKPEAVIHLAARCDLNGESLEDYKVNVEGVATLCEVIRETSSVKRVIFTSSQLVCNVSYLPKSDRDYKPNTVYGESKVLTEKTVWEYQGGGKEWCIVRPTTVWGPHMSNHYQTVLKFIEKGVFFHSGGGELNKSYAYAENIACQYMQLLKVKNSLMNEKVFYLADYKPFSLRSYVNKVAQCMQKPLPVTVPLFLCQCLAKLGDVINLLGGGVPYNSFRLNNIRAEYIFDLSNTEQVCGELPVNFEEGVKRTVSWYLSESNN